MKRHKVQYVEMKGGEEKEIASSEDKGLSIIPQLNSKIYIKRILYEVKDVLHLYEKDETIVVLTFIHKYD